MATMERRVQVLFDEELYDRLVAEAREERVSVGAFIRGAVDERLDRRRADVQAALRRLWASADELPQHGEDWEAMKDELVERPVLRDIS